MFSRSGLHCHSAQKLAELGYLVYFCRMFYHNSASDGGDLRSRAFRPVWQGQERQVASGNLQGMGATHWQQALMFLEERVILSGSICLN